jgi:hypothetical protein
LGLLITLCALHRESRIQTRQRACHRLRSDRGSSWKILDPEMRYILNASRAFFLLHFSTFIYVCSCTGILLECNGRGIAYVNGKSIMQINQTSASTTGVVSWDGNLSQGYNRSSANHTAAILWDGNLYEGDSLAIVADSSFPAMACAVEMTYIDISGASAFTVTDSSDSNAWRASTLALANSTSTDVSRVTDRGFFHCGWTAEVNAVPTNISTPNIAARELNSGPLVLRTSVGNMKAGCLPIRVTASGPIQVFVNGNLVASGDLSNIIHGMSLILQYGDVVAAMVTDTSGFRYLTAMMNTSLGFWDTNSAFLWRAAFATPDLLDQNKFTSKRLPEACAWSTPVCRTGVNATSTLSNIGITGIWPSSSNQSTTNNIALFRTVIGVGEGDSGCSSNPTCKAKVVKCV